MESHEKALKKSIMRHKIKEIDKRVKESMIKGPNVHKGTSIGKTVGRWAESIKS